MESNGFRWIGYVAAGRQCDTDAAVNRKARNPVVRISLLSNSQYIE